MKMEKIFVSRSSENVPYPAADCYYSPSVRYPGKTYSICGIPCFFIIQQQICRNLTCKIDKLHQYHAGRHGAIKRSAMAKLKSSVPYLHIIIWYMHVFQLQYCTYTYQKYFAYIIYIDFKISAQY